MIIQDSYLRLQFQNLLEAMQGATWIDPVQIMQQICYTLGGNTACVDQQVPRDVAMMYIFTLILARG